MKKRFLRTIAFTMALAMGLALSGCGSKEPETEAATEAEATTEEEEKIDYEAILNTMLPNFKDEQTQAMCNFNWYGMNYIEGKTFYGRFSVKGKDLYQFVKMELVDDPESSSYLTAGEWSILSEDVVPQFINKVGDTFYYVAQDWTKDNENPEYYIEKVSESGGDRTKICDGNGYLVVRGDKMYFTNADDKYVCTDLDGKNEEIIIDKEVYYPYFINDNWIMYQDDADNESLHVYSISDDMDFKLNDEPSYDPTIFENTVYFLTKASENENAYHMSKIDLTSYKIDGDNITFTQEKSDKLMGSKFMIIWNEEAGSEMIQGMNGVGSCYIDKWQDCEDTAYDGFTEEYFCLSDEVDAYVKYNDEGAEARCFMNKETGYGQSISALE